MLTFFKSHSVLSTHFSPFMLVQGSVRLMQLKESELRSHLAKPLIKKAYKAVLAMRGEMLQNPVLPAHG